MCMTLKLPESERNRQDRFVRCAEKRVCSTKLTQRRGPIHPHSSVPAASDDRWRTKRLISRKNPATLTSSDRQLGECRLKFRQTTEAPHDHLPPFLFWPLPVRRGALHLRRPAALAGALPLRKLPPRHIGRLRLVVRRQGWPLALDGAPPATYQSSPDAWRDFCPTCGSQMTYRSSRFPDETHFYAASLDDPAIYTPTAHVHTDEILPWVHLNDGLTRT
jgi:hypothetical protein